jgi:hypothetical protein
VGDKVIELETAPGRRLGLCKRHLPLLDRLMIDEEKRLVG